MFHTDRAACQINGEKGEIERYFRDIENATHDKWTHNKERASYNYLGKVMQKIPESLTRYLDIKSSLGNAASISGEGVL